MKCGKCLPYLPGDGEGWKASVSPGCYIDQNKARWERGGGSLRGEGKTLSREQRVFSSPLNQKKTKPPSKTFHKKLDEQGLSA